MLAAIGLLRAQARPRARGRTRWAWAVALGAQVYAAHVARLAVALVVTGLVFLALTPAWWSDPLHMPERVLYARSEVLRGQLKGYGGYDSWGDRAAGLIDFAFFAPPQYYEVPVWQEFVGDQITAYESTLLAGRLGGAIQSWLVAALFAGGVVALARRWREGPALLILLWPLLTALGLFLSTPLAWQRYYLPLQPGIAVVAAAGAAWLAARARERA